MEYVKLRTTKLHSLRSEIAQLRRPYAELALWIDKDACKTVAKGYVAIATFLNGELARARHEIRNYMMGLEDKESQSSGEQHVTEIRQHIQDISDAQQSIKRAENIPTREIAMEAHQQLVIEGEQQKIINRLQSIKDITILLENEIYDGE